MSSSVPGSRNVRKRLVGFVTSRSGAKSVKVTIAYKTPHPLYHKVINRKTVVHAHDEKDEAKVGDRVEIMETRPLSRLKRWRVVSIIERGITADAAISEADVAAQVPTKTVVPQVPATGQASSAPASFAPGGGASEAELAGTAPVATNQP
jgi:small subunit ribosomal protein S17